ncbi:MAG: SMP-30/gluconolactonase/LRE family protein [Kiloniellales bacterium]
MIERPDRLIVKARRRPWRLAASITALITLGFGVAAALWLLRPGVLFSPEPDGRLAAACRQLQVTDAQTGLPLRGIEDLAVLPDNSLILSTYDRWPVENRAAGLQNAAPGGLYRLAAPASWPTDRGTVSQVVSVEAENLTAELFPEVRPHGIDAVAKTDDGVRIFAVNRATGPAGDQVAVDVFDLEDERLRHVERIADPRLCRANDIAAVDDRHALITLDTSACDGRARWRELILGPPAGAVLHLTLSDEDIGDTPGQGDQSAQLTSVANGLRFANGIAIDGQWVWVAETRGQALMRLSLDAALQRDGTSAAASTTPPIRYPLSAAPDNLTIDAEGGLLVTQHPSLLRLALHRAAWLQLSGSGTRVDRVTHEESGSIESRLEWLDPQGTLLAAGTVAAEVPGALLIGSVTADGLAFCPS